MMSPAPTSSVVIPTTGRIGFLQDALHSVQAQTVPVSQVVVVCDGVTARDYECIEELASGFHGVETHRLRSPRGAAAARNVGLEKARGDYLLFLDDDDLLHPRMLENAIGLFTEHPLLDVAVCLYQVVFTPSGPGDYPEVFPFNPRLMERHPLNLVDGVNFAEKQVLEQAPLSAFLRYLVPINSCVIRRMAIGETRFSEDLVQGEDTFFWVSLSHRGCTFRLSEKPYACIRRHGGNTTRSKQAYIREIPRCYERIRSSGMLSRREDRFLVELKLFYFAWKAGRWSSLPALAALLRYPVLMAKEIAKFFRTTLRDRRRLLKYYIQD